ncbi:MAG: hypothetical protein ABH827_05365 [bacterium]
MNSSLSLSLELICLLSWLLKNEKHMLNDVVKEAIKNGLIHDINKLELEEMSKITEDLDTTILDFLIYLEDSLADNLKTVPYHAKAETDITPTLKKIESIGFNPNTLRTSIKQVKAQIIKEKQHNPKVSTDTEYAKQVLFKQIIKNWKPSSKDTMN